MRKFLKSLLAIFAFIFCFALSSCSKEEEKTKVNRVEPNCTTEGNIEYYTDSKGYYVLENGEYKEITKQQTVIAAKGHTPKEAVIENEISATCEIASSHDEVVYCADCNAEISRNSVQGAKLDHHMTTITGNIASNDKDYYYCDLCEKYYMDQAGTKVFENIEQTVELLNSIEFNDLTFEYDGQRHKIEYTGVRPEGVRITCTPNKDYYEIGEYKYTLKIVINGTTYYKYAYLNITKLQPLYLGQTEYTVYMNDPTTQPDIKFNYEDVVAEDVPYYTNEGDFVYTLKTRETSLYEAFGPVDITYHVFKSKTGCEFIGQDFVINKGENVGIYLTGVENLPAGYSVIYTNNTASTQGHYKAVATVYDESNNEVESFRAMLNVDYYPNAQFETYVTQIFKDYIEGDQLTLNIFTIDYEAMGLEHGDAIWYSFKGYDEYTLEDFANDQLEIAKEREAFNNYATYDLSYGQWISFRRIDEFLKLYEALLKDYEYNFIAISYVDQYGGYAADFPTDMEAYQLRNKQDIEDFISYFNSTYDSFNSYYNFIVAKKEKGYGYSKSTLEEYAKYLDGVIKAFNSYDGYYLCRVALEKLDVAKVSLNLTDDEYNDYKARLEASLVVLKNAHTNLYEKVSNFIATETYFNDKSFTGQYLGKTKQSQAYYYTLLQNKLGTFNMTPDQYLERLEEYIQSAYKYYKNSQSNSSIGADIADGKVKVFDYGDDILSTFDFLKEFAKTIVLDLKTTPEIDVTWMDPTVTANTTTMAYYMKSPLDYYEKEYIHLNGRQLTSSDSSNYELMSTIAHEGYPGHLYAYVNTKENPNLSYFVKMATYTGHGEGWAKYVESQFAYYIASLHKDEDTYDQYLQFVDYNNAQELFYFLLYARVDFGINYQGWLPDQVASYASTFGLKFSDPTGFFNTLNGNPATYPSYGYGHAVFADLHQRAKEALGSSYHEPSFNQFLLDHGWCSLDSLEEYVTQYIDEHNFLLRKD